MKKQDRQIIETYDASESFDHLPELIEFKRLYPVVVEMAIKLAGRIRSAAVHACMAGESKLLTNYGYINFIGYKRITLLFCRSG